MAIDMEPAAGRYILGRGRSTEFFPWYEKGGKITRVVGKRVYYTDETGAEKFLHEYSAIVDTPAEVTSLLEFTTKGKALVDELKESLGHMRDGIVARAMAASTLPTAKRSRTRKQ